ncbi:sensor domain-containing diguanylate cyclase [Acetobacterium woodii]|uniref:Response regulator-like protein n=1 Tax=Acetobacterium woodii (strain ATCC 29683 / DSM 1030 / JCM 2381 / KCTC 1655 / WB1) TaxID=931626 RepID=H6LF85_ACEWD|nr:sensor domain-containing diguanylate cyclase [Acetobacterium woodii]AFA48185.1 response regulator-like protein [Acetobacterium woodii DSM 1030]
MIKTILDEKIANKYDFDLNMLKMIIESIPANVFFKDPQCRYQMVSHLCSMLSCDEEGWSIIGKTDLEVQKDPELAKLYYEDDLQIIKTRKGAHYFSEMVFGKEKYYYEIIKEPIIDGDGNLQGIVGIVNDVTELKRLEEKAHHVSITDKLTGAYNRNYYEQKIIEIPQKDNLILSVIMCDTNGLKFLNDNFGHQTGDMLLKITVSIIKNVIGDSGEVMRIGGDEFMIFCYDCPEEQCRNLIKDIREKEQDWKYFNIPISNAYGYATIRANNCDLATAVKEAEQMMYQDKEKTKESYLENLKRMVDQNAQMDKSD